MNLIFYVVKLHRHGILLSSYFIANVCSSWQLSIAINTII